MLVTLFTLALALLPAQTAAERLAKAEAAMAGLDYEAAAVELEVLLGDASLTEDEQIRANLLAGMANRVIGRDVDARMHFSFVLSRRPDAELPPDASPKLRTFFELIRSEQLRLPVPRPTVDTHPAPVARPGPQLQVSERAVVEARSWTPQHTVAAVVGGLGALGFGASGFFTAVALSNEQAADALCVGRQCADPRGFEASRSAVEAANTATWCFGLGAAGVIAGAVTLLVAPAAPTEQGPPVAFESARTFHARTASIGR